MSANGISQAAATNGHGQSTETSLQNDKSMPIAIIGMACRFPGEATNVENFWNMLTSKRDAWTEVPKERFNVDAFYHPDPDRNGSVSAILIVIQPRELQLTFDMKFNSRGGYFLSQDISAFDAQFFSISPAEAKSMDPQQRILLETVYDAMENAGLPLETVMGSETSCYIANVSRDYYDILARDPETLPVYQSTGNGASIISNRVSYFYNLKGPSMTLDSACSSSLVAIHLACQSIQSGESKQAIVGATNMVIAPDLNIGLSNLHFLSPDARCYSFDSRSNGYVRGEGIGAVILKPLEQALTDNDLIRAVIRGSSCNQDGRTAGITLPSQSAQEALITKAYDVAGCDPAVTTYFEAHGTGTKVGDPIETGAIGATMGPHRTPGEDGNLYIGSVKPNIGHLEAASGLAGLIKTVLSLEKGVIAPNILYENPNARIDFQGWRIKVPTSVVPWPVQGLRRASVNSFGYGGTNAHVILDDALHYLQARKLRGLHNTASKPLLQENIGRESAVGDQYHHTNDRRDRVFVWTGQEEGAVKSLCASYAQYCASIKPEDAEAFLDSLAHTLWERRSRLQWTTSVVANSTESLVQALQSDTLVAARRSNGAVKIGFVFTGQGAQWWGMGRELISAYQTFRQTLVDADQAVKGFGADWSLIGNVFW
jgi:acyl transferase domain-containing protein